MRKKREKPKKNGFGSFTPSRAGLGGGAGLPGRSQSAPAGLRARAHRGGCRGGKGRGQGPAACAAAGGGCGVTPLCTWGKKAENWGKQWKIWEIIWKRRRAARARSCSSCRGRDGHPRSVLPSASPRRHPYRPVSQGPTTENHRNAFLRREHLQKGFIWYHEGISKTPQRN